MVDVDPDQLRQAVENQHGGKATYVESVPMVETFHGKKVWEGTVVVFDLDGCPNASRAYAWSLPIEGSTKRRYFAVLHLGGIRSPQDAVRAAIFADYHNTKTIAAVTPKAWGKLIRIAENDATATEARFWKKPRSAESVPDHTRPINRRAAKEVSPPPKKKSRRSN